MTNKLTAHINQEYIDSLIPEKDSHYTAWGNYDIIKRYVESKRKYNVYLTGLSGCGKTKSIEQVCAELQRPMILLPITSETTERQLMGGFVLQQGEFVWKNGAVLEAMLIGAVLILDEIDKGTSSLMCLQGILNGDKRIYIKELGETVVAKEGFQVFATANTKGSGDDKGLFNTSNILDGALLDRFHAMIDQGYPSKSVEMNILKNSGANITESDANIITEISERTRKLFEEDAIDDVISTRQIINIAKTKEDIYYDAEDPLYSALEASINRFSEQSKDSIFALYTTLKNPEEAVLETNEIQFELDIDSIPDFDSF